MKYKILPLLILSITFFALNLWAEENIESSSTWYQPKPGVTWHWQLTGTINESYPVEIYDIDLFDSSAELIARLKQEGKKVICYFSAGSYEEWREDADEFPENVLGRPLQGWPGERWLDIRSDKVKEIMKRRLDLAKEKGCDGVEPDNVDGYLNNTGFPLTAQDQLKYNIFIATEAHKRGLSVALKNDLEQIQYLVDYFDFSINEQCHEYNECDMLMPFINAGKPVLNAEYANNKADAKEMVSSICPDANLRNFSTLILPIDLDDEFRVS